MPALPYAEAPHQGPARPLPPPGPGRRDPPGRPGPSRHALGPPAPHSNTPHGRPPATPFGARPHQEVARSPARPLSDTHRPIPSRAGKLQAWNQVSQAARACPRRPPLRSRHTPTPGARRQRAQPVTLQPAASRHRGPHFLHTPPLPPSSPPNAEMSLLLRATGAAASPEPKFAQGLANETRGGGRGRGVRDPREAGSEAKAGIPRVGAAQASSVVLSTSVCACCLQTPRA